MYLLTLILPTLLFLITSFFGRFIGHKGIYLISKYILMILMIIVLLLFNEIVLDGNICTINLFNWFLMEDLNINWVYLIDDLSLILLILVFSISYIVIIYSYDYLIEDPHIIRFYSYIFLFILCMILLVSTSSLPILFIGWEGVGLSSFLLISFWYTRQEAALGALLAFSMNRIGDLFILLSIFFSQFLLGSVDIFTLISYPSFNSDIITIFILLGAMAKSAQISLHIWLPYSMEGPTPISALIHAATMVTAGIFLLIRFSLMISYSYYTLILLLFIGSLTAFIGGTLAIISLDLKELIAYSTMSQLGYMVTILGLQSSSLSFYHLINHAYFKALLFLTAGSIIHSVADLQDFRKSGSLINFLPISYSTLIIGFSSLTGLPFTTGFYSKESILNNAIYSYQFLGEFIYWITLLSAFFTIYYSFGFLLKVFLNTTRISIYIIKNIHYYSLNLTFSIFILGFITIFFGYFTFQWIYMLSFPISFYSLQLPFFIKCIPIVIFIMVINIYIFYRYNNNYNIKIISNYYNFSGLYKRIGSLFLSFSYRILFKLSDYGWIDLLGPIFGHHLINKAIQIEKVKFKE